MRNLNKGKVSVSSGEFAMFYINYEEFKYKKKCEYLGLHNSFILTMRNLNVIESELAPIIVNVLY